VNIPHAELSKTALDVAKWQWRYLVEARPRLDEVLLVESQVLKLVFVFLRRKYACKRRHRAFFCRILLGPLDKKVKSVFPFADELISSTCHYGRHDQLEFSFLVFCPDVRDITRKLLDLFKKQIAKRNLSPIYRSSRVIAKGVEVGEIQGGNLSGLAAHPASFGRIIVAHVLKFRN
jgi:hypothetical protein